MGVKDFFDCLDIATGLATASEPFKHERAGTYLRSFKKEGTDNTNLPIYENVYFDVNHLLHSTGLHTTNEFNFFRHLTIKIYTILNSVRVTNTVYFAVDGPSPRAKLFTQRKRRLHYARRDERKKNAEESEAKEEDEVVEEPVSDLEASFAQQSQHESINKNNFTPGTDFMQRLNDFLYLTCNTLLQKYGRFRNVNFYVSPSDRVGEGEHKIFQHIQHLAAENTGRMQNVLVVGEDSDLVLYGLHAVPDVHILRTSKWQLYKMSALKTALETQFPGKDIKRIVDDFTFMTLLNGNDFVPKLAFYSFEKHWNNYRSVIFSSEKYLTESRVHENLLNVNISMMKEILVGELRHSPVSEMTEKQFAISICERYKIGIPIFETSKNLNELGYTTTVELNDIRMATAEGETPEAAEAAAASKLLTVNNRKQLYEMSQGFNRDKYYMERMATRFPNDTRTEELHYYLQGIAWIMRYLKGLNADGYYYKFQISPTIFSLIAEPDGIRSIRIGSEVESPLTPLEFCVSLLPKASKDLAPAEVQSIYEDNSPIADLTESSEKWLMPDAIKRLKDGISWALSQSKVPASELASASQGATVKFNLASMYSKEEAYALPIPDGKLITFRWLSLDQNKKILINVEKEGPNIFKPLDLFKHRQALYNVYYHNQLNRMRQSISGLHSEVQRVSELMEYQKYVPDEKVEEMKAQERLLKLKVLENKKAKPTPSKPVQSLAEMLKSVEKAEAEETEETEASAEDEAQKSKSPQRLKLKLAIAKKPSASPSLKTKSAAPIRVVVTPSPQQRVVKAITKTFKK